MRAFRRAALGLLFLSLPAAAADLVEEADHARLEPGLEVRRGEVALRGHLDWTPDGALRVSADVRPMIEQEPLPRRGTYLPHLPLGFTLTEEWSGRQWSGEMRFAWSDHGPHYEALVAGALDLAGPLHLGFRSSDARFDDVAGYGWGYPDPGRIPQEPAEDGGNPEITPAAIRMDLVGQLDSQPSMSYSDIWGYESGGTFIAIMGATSGSSFIDVTDPANPVEVAFISGPSSSWRDMKTYSNYAYIGTEGGGGVQIVDLSDPLNPVLVNTWNTTFSSSHNLYIDETRGLLYAIGTDNGTRILDLTVDPEDPTEVGVWNTRYVHDAYAIGDRAYFSAINNGLQEIIDVSDVANPTLVNNWPTPQGSAHNAWVNDAGTLLVSTDEVSAGGFTNFYDISDELNVTRKSFYQPLTTTSVHNAKFDDDDNEQVWLAHYSIGLHLLDSHRPTKPVVWGYYDTYPNSDSGFNGNWGVYAYDSRGYAYASDRSTGLYILDYAPTGGTLSGIVRDASTLQPLEGAEVIVLQNEQTSLTGADGVYATYAEAGPVRVRASKFGYRSAVLAAPQMTLGGRVDVDLALAPLEARTVSGVVTRSDNGNGIAGARVRIDGTPFDTTTDGSGAYQFLDVPIGPRTLTVDVFGFELGSAAFDIQPGADAVVDVVLDPAAFADDTESDPGWQSAAPGDTGSSTGVWWLTDPFGTGGGSVQPEDDHTPDPGVQCWHTGPAGVGAGIEATDVDLGYHTLTSPTIDAAGLQNLELSYFRWLSRNAGAIDVGELLVHVSNDDGANWTLVELVDFEANSWNENRFNVSAALPLTSTMKVRFRADGKNFADSVTEAAVDDIMFREACDAFVHPNFADSDTDGVIDACDACPFDARNDEDGDGLCADVDNAPRAANPSQTDGDADGVGDAGDNCPATPNTDQRDLDRDGAGDLCDNDVDGDGTDNAADADDDNDGIADGSDLCPNARDPFQRDRDTDGVGDACDFDDGEVTGLRFDGAPLVWEAEQGSDSYNVYRGLLGAPELLPLAGCARTGLTGTEYVDASAPEVGDGFSYLVTRVAAGVEGPLGTDSSGVERSINEVCP